MTRLSIRAHFDGSEIVLDEPATLEPGASLLVTVLPKNDAFEHDAWLTLSQQGLGGAYGADEIEYSIDTLRESNPYYEGS